MSISVWAWKEERVLKRIQCAGRPNCLTLTAEGKHIIVGGEQGSRPHIRPFLAVIDLATGEAIRTFASNGRVITAVAVSPDGQTVLAGDSHGLLEHYSLDEGRLLGSITGHKKRVEDIFFLGTTGTSRGAITASQDGRIARWDLVDIKEQWYLDTGRRITSMVLSPAADRVAVGAPNGWIAIWELSDLDEKLGKLTTSTSAPASGRRLQRGRTSLLTPRTGSTILGT